MFIIAILLLNFFLLCKKCYIMMKNHPYIADDDMHMGEYSQIGMDGLNNHEDT